MSVDDETVSFSLEINVKPTYEDIRKVQTVVYRYISLMRRLGLPENVDDAIEKMQRLIMISNQLRLSFIALQAASGPVGWALALAGLAGTALTTGEFLYDVTRGY